jgi:CMP-N,N'-diacetyllegionaminic acid synthase
MKKKVLCIIPARGGSKRILGKNIKLFCGKPLISYAIEQAKKCGFCDRIIVDTDSSEIAKVAKKYGAEVPFLRPSGLATDKAKIIDAMLYLINRLKKDENYEPTHIMLLQTTSPLREISDICDCWDLMEKTKATTVSTVCPSEPLAFRIDHEQNISLSNGMDLNSVYKTKWPPLFVLNGMVYIVSLEAFCKEFSLFTRDTRAVICPFWRSIDLDTPDEFVMAELLYKNQKKINAKIKSLNAHGQKS